MISRAVLGRRDAEIRLLYKKGTKYTARTFFYTLAPIPGANRREKRKMMWINEELQNVKKVGIIAMM